MSGQYKTVVRSYGVAGLASEQLEVVQPYKNWAQNFRNLAKTFIENFSLVFMLLWLLISHRYRPTYVMYQFGPFFTLVRLMMLMSIPSLFCMF